MTKRIISCGAPYGKGGLGLHLQEVTQHALKQNENVHCFCFSTRTDPDCTAVDTPLFQTLMKTPLRMFPGWRSYLSCTLFDTEVAKKLPKADALTGFVGQSLKSFQRAKALGYKQLEVMAANSHVDNVRALHAQANKLHNFDPSWLNSAQIEYTKEEYKTADTVIVASEYSRLTFLERGFDGKNIKRLYFYNDPRFVPPVSRPDDGYFRIVYTGSITVAKGIPVLLEAFSRLSTKNARLTLVGGYATRGMRQYIEQWLAKDSRIIMAPGDPLPHLQQADVYVHPSWEDGWAYAPAEALACSTPVIVTEDTGMKEIVIEGVNGYVVPTGKWEAILERLEYIQNHSLTGFTPPEQLQQASLQGV